MADKLISDLTVGPFALSGLIEHQNGAPPTNQGTIQDLQVLLRDIAMPDDTIPGLKITGSVAGIADLMYVSNNSGFAAFQVNAQCAFGVFVVDDVVPFTLQLSAGHTNKAFQILDSGNNQIFAIGANGSMGIAGGIIDSGGILSINSSSRQLLATDGTTVVLDYATQLLSDTSAVGSVDWENRLLLNSSGGTFLDFSTGTADFAPSDTAPSAGAGSPEGVVTRSPGAPYFDTTNTLLYLKQTGTGNTGWYLFG